MFIDISFIRKINNVILSIYIYILANFISYIYIYVTSFILYIL